MARVSKVEGTVRVFTESGGSFALTVTGHGMQGSNTVHDLGPYVGKLIADELRKVLADEPAPPAAPPPPKPLPVKTIVREPVAAPLPKPKKGTHRG